MWGSGSGHVQVARELEPALPSNERVRCHRALPRQRRHGRADKRRHARAGTEALKELEPGPCCHSATRESSARAWDSRGTRGARGGQLSRHDLAAKRAAPREPPAPAPRTERAHPRPPTHRNVQGAASNAWREEEGGGASGVSGAAPGAAATQRGHPLCLLKESRWPPVRGLQ